MSSEQQIQQQIRLALSNGQLRLFRNNTGALRDADGRLIRFGLCEGSSDLIGFHTIEVTPDMIGERLAVFCAIEVKAANGRTTQQQRAFLQLISASGGLAGVARSVEDAVRIVSHHSG